MAAATVWEWVDEPRAGVPGGSWEFAGTEYRLGSPTRYQENADPTLTLGCNSSAGAASEADLLLRKQQQSV